MNFKLESDEDELCTESSLICNQLITSSCFELCDVQGFHCQKVCAIEGPDLYLCKNEEICILWYCFISDCFLCLHYNLHYFSMWLTSAWVICMSQ